MKIATSKTRDKYPLSFNKIIKKTLAPIIPLFILLCVLCGILLYIPVYASRFADNPSPSVSPQQIQMLSSWMYIAIVVIVVLFIIDVAWQYFYQRWYFSTYFYDLTNDHIVIKKGTVAPTEVTIPYERIQDVYVDQDVLDRILTLYDVHLSSATVSSGMEAHIDGLGKEAADGLKAELLKVLGDRIGKKD